MSTSTAELTFLIKAQNLAGTALKDVQRELGAVGDKAVTAADRWGKAFKGKAGTIAREVGNLARDLLSGQSLEQSGIALGTTLVVGVVTAFAGQIIEKILASGAITTLGAALSASIAAQGSILGGVLAVAIPIGMAALPFLLLAAAVAALVYLATHPEVRDKVAQVARHIVGWLIDHLAKLPGLLLDVFKNAVNWVVKNIGPVVGGIVKWFTDIPKKIDSLVQSIPAVIGRALRAALTLARHVVDNIVNTIKRIATAISNALRSLSTFHWSGGNDPVADFLGINHHAAGGWVGLKGPELAMVGEKGPEYVIPNHQLGGGGGGQGVRIVGVSARELADIVDRELYVRIQRAAPTLART